MLYSQLNLMPIIRPSPHEYSLSVVLSLERLDIPVLEAKVLVTQSNIQYYIFYSTQC